VSADKTLPAYHLPKLHCGNDFKALAVSNNINQTGFTVASTWEQKRTGNGKEWKEGDRAGEKKLSGTER
jgi:hypothetical protein